MLTTFAAIAAVGLAFVIGSFLLGQLDGGDSGDDVGGDGGDAHGDAHGDGDAGDGHDHSHDHHHGHGTAGDPHAHHHAPSPLPLFSPTALAALLIGTGLGGAAGIEWLGLGDLLAWAAALPAGIGGWVGMAALSRAIVSLGGGGRSVNRRAFVGEEAEVTVTIPAAGLGEIVFTSQGERHSGPARDESARTWPLGSRVMVQRVDDEGIFVVGAPLDEVLESGSAGVEPESDPDEVRRRREAAAREEGAR